jgi:hypothetical protein
MIHPETELRLIDSRIGHGLVAARFIPRGTLVYVQDALDILIPPDHFEALDEVSREIAEKYSFIDPNGTRVLSWDMAKYVNHSCNPNTVSTAWGFEIAIRDIAPGEEITDDYGLFNLEWEMNCECGFRRCRGAIGGRESDPYYRRLDRLIRLSLVELRKVDQPLIHVMDQVARQRLEDYLDRKSRYRSVKSLLIDKRRRDSNVSSMPAVSKAQAKVLRGSAACA